MLARHLVVPSDVLAAAGRARSNIKFLTIYSAEGDIAVGPGRAGRHGIAIELRGYDCQRLVGGCRE